MTPWFVSKKKKISLTVSISSQILVFRLSTERSSEPRSYPSSSTGLCSSGLLTRTGPEWSSGADDTFPDAGPPTRQLVRVAPPGCVAVLRVREKSRDGEPVDSPLRVRLRQNSEDPDLMPWSDSTTVSAASSFLTVSEYREL